MMIGGIIGYTLGINAENKPLEDISQMRKNI